MLSLFNTELRNPPFTPYGVRALCINLLWPRQSIFNFNYFQNSFIICLFCELEALLSWWVYSREWSDFWSGSGGMTFLSSEGLLWWLSGKKTCLPVQKTHVHSLGQEIPLEKETATHSSIPAWEIPSIEKPGRLQSMGLQNSQTRLRD